MSGKCRPSQDEKVIYNVLRSNLSYTNVKFIEEVIKRYRNIVNGDTNYVEVVRCKDCEYFVPADKDREGGFCDFWSKHDCVVELGGNEYCSNGERRKE